MAAPRCSSCASSLASVKLSGHEAFRCPGCAGLWVDLPVLEQAAGESFELQALGEVSKLSCGRCSKPLDTAVFPGGIPLEACLNCRGVFLRNADDASLVEVVMGLPERRKAAKTKAKAVDGVKIVAEMFAGVLEFFKK